MRIHNFHLFTQILLVGTVAGVSNPGGRAVGVTGRESQAGSDKCVGGISEREGVTSVLVGSVRGGSDKCVGGSSSREGVTSVLVGAVAGRE